MKVRDKTCCATTGTIMQQNNVVKCLLNFDQHTYKPGNTVKCFITLTFAEEFKYRSMNYI